MATGSSAAAAAARKLEGKVALITGGASGIGACTARLFVRHGASVVVADVQDEAGALLCADLGAQGASSICYVRCDVTVEPDVAAAVDHAVARFGKLDIMFNNAGIGGDGCHSVRDSTKEDFERVLAVNLVGPFLGTKHAARVMGRGGSIFQTSSLSSVRSGMASAAYTCAKRGLVGLAENAAAELGRHGIRVNCVSPAGVATPLALGYLGLDGKEFEMQMEAIANLKGVGGGLRAEDIAAAVLFLASDDARYVSGHNLVVDGGISVASPSLGTPTD
ncbi:momilactone A synthase [Brachypodium distachyon]|uniref:Uncharacterized protein n=1 Tax=Brachypodium distachyon TaxID=15368 RepID=I1IXZ5_BRADI|nr:momilactone A synthase [Brachypodium distachyon]KQJ82745.1 hypothetical protein BRADI_5g10757v3 [Brachypodium distachyon]|eukprot:XP_003579803.1 momilactone A synthase [Brachypodium distachyon]